jgi:PAS domain S-box-containing protein
MRETVKQWSPRTILAGTFTLSALPLVIVMMFPSRLSFVMTPASYLVFHNIAEFFSIMVSLSMFGLGWYTYEQSKDRHALFLSITFFGIGIMDFMHTLSNAAMPAFITPNSSNKSIQFWIGARLFQAVAFLISAYVSPGRPSRWLSRGILLTSALLVSFLVFTGIIFFPTYMPTTFLAGAGLTPFKKICEYLIVLLLCVAVAAYWKRMARTRDRLLLYYVAAFVICIFSEIPFALYTRVFETYNVLGHIYKVAAFYLIYYGIYKASVKDPYVKLAEIGEELKRDVAERLLAEQELQTHRDHLEELVKGRTSQLEAANAQLQVEITERKRMEEAVRESEDRLRIALETSHTGAWDLDLVDHSAFRSLEHDRIFGYAELLPQWTYEMFLEHVVPEDRATVNAKFQRAVDTQSDWSFECRIRRANGQVRWIWAAGRHRRDTSDVPRRMAGIVQDITERKQVEESLRQRTSELQQLTETLEQQVQERTEELEVANEQLRSEIAECQRIDTALRKSQSDLRRLSLELLNAHEKERRLVAREIHDSIGSSLVAVKFKVETVLTEVPDKSRETTTALKSVIPIVQGAIDDARRIQMNLRPSMLDDLGILATIAWLCRQFESTYSGIRIRQSIKIEEHEVPDSLKTVIFRVLQEGLNNVAKHSKAKMVSVFLRKTGQMIKLVIRDYGQGFDLSKAQSPGDTTHGFGLKSMRERTELSGGSFDIKSTKGKGTIIRASWPLN